APLAQRLPGQGLAAGVPLRHVRRGAPRRRPRGALLDPQAGRGVPRRIREPEEKRRSRVQQVRGGAGSADALRRGGDQDPGARALTVPRRVGSFRKPALSFGAAALVGAIALGGEAPPAGPVTLTPGPKTVAWGYYDAATPAVLRVRSGDTVQIRTLITTSPSRLEEAGVAASDVEPSLRPIHQEVTNKGPGGHILTGPVFVEGAVPGDVLEVRILAIDLAIPYAYDAFSPGRGFLPEDFPYARMKIVPLDTRKMVARFAPGIASRLRPFFGGLGVAPPPVSGRISSGPPWVHAGNLDNRELVAGTTLYIPVHAPGALFLAGDGHAGQGNGEVDITALETSL